MLTLTERCLQLPYRERINLLAAIQDSILQERREKKPRYQNRGRHLLDMMWEILGEPVSLKSRLSKFVWARTMVAYQLTREGFSTIEAGKMIGKDHSTIIRMRENMRNALEYPAMYRTIVNIWNQFQNNLQDETH